MSPAAASSRIIDSAPVTGRVPPPVEVEVGPAAEATVADGAVVDEGGTVVDDVEVVVGSTTAGAVSTQAPELKLSHPNDPQAGAAVPLVCQTIR